MIGVNPAGGWICRAFVRIPVDILARRVKHNAPYEGDHGIQFEEGPSHLTGRADSKEDKEPELVRAAGVMYVDDAGHVLMVRRSDTGEWAFPGGRIESGESADEAARRECEEEVGHSPKDLRLWTRRVADGVDFTTFLCRVPEQFEPKLNDEHTAHSWERLGDYEGDSLAKLGLT